MVTYLVIGLGIFAETLSIILKALSIMLCKPFSSFIKSVKNLKILAAIKYMATTITAAIRISINKVTMLFDNLSFCETAIAGFCKTYTIEKLIKNGIRYASAYFKI